MYAFHKPIAIGAGTYDLTAAGEVLIDMISHSYDSSFMGDSFTSYFGGSPANVAVNMANLGHTSSIIASIGEEPFGEYIESYLRQAGVHIQGLQRQRSHPTSMVVVSRSEGNPRFIAYRQADRMLEADKTALDLAANSRILHFTSWPISMEPARGTILELIDAASQGGALVGFDPNYREILWEQGHDGRRFIRELLPKIDVIKPSDDDAQHLFGPGSPAVQMQRFLDCGAGLVLLTLGRDGCLAGSGSQIHHIPSRADEVVDVTGAGDAFWSGFYSGVLCGFTVERALQRANAAAAHKLRQTGAVMDLSLDALKQLEGDRACE